MKQNLLFNQLTAMPKRLAMVLTVLFTLGVGSVWGEEFTKISSLSDLTTGDYVIVGYQKSSSYGRLISGTLNSKRLSYTSHYTAAPNSCTITNATEIWHLEVTGTGNTRNVTIYNDDKEQYLNLGFAWSNSSISWTVSYNNGFSFKSSTSTEYLGVNKSAAYWRSYASSTLTSIYGITLLKAASCTEISPKLSYSPSLLDIGNTANPTLTGNTGGGTVTYSSNNTDVATVNSSTGVVTAVAAGSATITASIAAKGAYCDGSATATITVNEQQTTITLSEAGSTRNPSGTFYVGDSYTLPSTTTATCGDKTFVGWSTVTIDNSAGKPASDFYERGVSVTLGANNTFYAVFAESGGGLSDANEVLLNYEGGTSSNLNNTEGLSVSGNGSDYADSNAPYRVKLDGTGDYILYHNESKPYISQVYFKVKMIGGENDSKITIKTSDDGKNYTSQSECTISGDQNSVKTFTVNINTYAKYVQLYFTKGSNIGFGPLIIYTKSSSYQNYTTECSAPSEYTVTFNANGHGTAPTAQTVESGHKATEPTAPTAIGYTFGGWYEESECTNMFDFNTAITADITLYAKWTPITYTVSFNNNGGRGTMVSQPFTYNVAQNLTSNTFTRTGYTFNGWNTQANGQGTNYTDKQSVKNLASTNGATITLYAQWKIQTFTVTFNSNGGTGTMVSQPFTYNVAQNLTSNTFTRTGYTFNGWNTQANGQGTTYTDQQSVTLTTAGLTLYAQWKANTYTVEFNANGGTGSMSNQSFTYGQSQSLTANAFTRTNYAFKNWNTKADGSGANYTDKQSVSNLTTTNGETVTLYAQWTPIYTITWLANGQEFHKQENAVKGTVLDVPDSKPDAANYACDDKVFVGWTATPISGTSADEPDDLFTTKTANVEDAATTYYAVFATADGSSGSAGGETETTLDFSAQGYENGEVVESLTIGDVTIDLNKGTNSNDTKYYSTGTAVRVYGGGYFTVSIPSGNITKIVITTGSGDGTNAISADSDTYDTTNKTWTGSASSVKFSIAGSTGHRRIKSVDVTYTTGGGTSYSDYVTTCAVIPDPVWGGAEIDNATISVNCGETSPMNSAATISFPAATNNTLTYDITVTASEGFLVSTNKTDAAKYGASVTVSPNKTGDNAGKITQNVYVVAVAPAMSDEDFMGTITLSGKQLAENQVIDVTADVTCTTYTLTLNDRGTKTTAEYYAGASVPKPAAPEGVCTDPINYVFDGWSLDPVTDENTTSYEEVTFPFDMPAGKTTLYAVYRYVEDGSADSGDYVKLTEDLDDYSGDYLIVYEAGSLALNGALVGDGLDASGNSISVTITDNTIVATDEVNASNFTIAKEDDGYSIRSASGYYIGQTTNGNDLKTNSTEYYANTITLADDDNVDIVSSGAYLRYNAATGNTNLRFRYYKSDSYTSQKAIALYRKAASYLYTTSPVCGPHLAITEGKDIYVTGGNAGGTRDLVIAQTKVSYKATRLEKDKSTGNLPSIKALPSNIVFDNTKTKAVAVTFDEDSVRTLQSDGTYTITGNITIAYQPVAAKVTDDIQVTLNANYNPSADVSQASFTVHARSLPSEFVIVAKSGDKWYALNGDMANGSSANPANGQVTLNDDTNPTKATYAPCNTIYTFDGVPNTGDRTYVRFQGTDGAWLWASSGNNVGIQNNVLKTTPEGSNKAYNWKLYTEDNITYRFGNANSSRQLTLSGEKFGMYASGVQDIRILPYEAKCLYNYAPTNLKVSVLKGTYVTLTWDAVAGATKYQYSTNGTTWTDCGTEPTVTINGLTGATKYTYYIRAYHEDASVSQECIDYAEITFTTADCDDVPTNITYTADLNSITVSWTAAAPTATIKLFMDAEGTHMAGSYPDATSPYRISGGLKKNTTYYIQILADGTCASPIVAVKTEDVEVDIVEWKPDGIIVDINTNEKIGVTLENEVSYGSGLGTEATELFFSKYYEASYNVKLVAIYNGTKNIIDLTDYTIQYGKTSWETNYITLKDFGATKGQIQPGEEIILYSMQDGTQDDEIMDCVHEDFPDGNWVEVTSSNNEGKGILSFAGDKTIILCKTEYDDEADEYYDNIIDVIGALKEDPNEGILPTNENTEKPSWGDKEGWVCETGLSIADDSQIGISTNRCLLIRNNTVTSGENAVANNINDFVTLCSEWKGAQVPDNNVDNGVAASCENFAYVGTFDYSDYYTKYVPMGDEQVFDENTRNADGTVTIPITDLYKHSCSNIRVKLTKENGEVLSDREYKVPIMITTTQGTDGQAFLDLQQNLATKEVDGEGNVIDTHPLSLEEVREICKTCDVVVRDNATLTKVTDGTTNDHPQVHDVIVYEGASIVIPDGINHNYTINSLALRRKGDEVASAQVQGTGKFVLPAEVPVTLSMRIDANNWHWFTLPYDCDIADVTWSDGTEAKYNTDWFLMYYDGESRSNQKSNYESHWKVYNGTTIEAGKGYIIGITGDLTHPDYTFELRFPMAQEVLAAEQTDKTVAVNAWGVKKDIRPNHKGWNLVGNPYMDYYQPNTNGFAGLPLIKYLSTNSAGEWLYDDSGTVPFLVIPQNGGWSEYKQELASDVDMQPFTAYFVQVGDPNNEEHSDGVELNARFEADKRGRSSLIRRAPSEVDELEEPAIVAVSLTNAKGESDKTTLLIADRFTNEYEMNADFFKWFGDYYTYYTKPVLYTLGADKESRAFNALNEELAAQPVALGMYAAQAGNYTFSLHQRSNLTGVAEVWLHDASNNTHTNLLQDDYTFSTSKTNGSGRFSLSVKMIQKLPTDVENIKQGNVWATTQDNEIVINGLTKDMQLWIYDATGKLVHADRSTNYQHSYSVPQTGAYFIRVQNKNGAQTIKVVVE